MNVLQFDLFCKNCGHEMSSTDNNFCSKCGKSVNDEKESIWEPTKGDDHFRNFSKPWYKQTTPTPKQRKIALGIAGILFLFIFGIIVSGGLSASQKNHFDENEYYKEIGVCWDVLDGLTNCPLHWMPNYKYKPYPIGKEGECMKMGKAFHTGEFIINSDSPPAKLLMAKWLDECQ